jgi:hypothetical protein
MAIAGTNPGSLEDIRNDVQLGLGVEGTRFSRAKRFLRSHPEVHAFTGHSLGGSVAMELAASTGKPAVVFNPGVPPSWLPRFKGGKFGGAPVAIYRTKMDPVSALAPGAHVVNQAVLDLHGVDNFTSSHGYPDPEVDSPEDVLSSFLSGLP